MCFLVFIGQVLVMVLSGDGLVNCTKPCIPLSLMSSPPTPPLHFLQLNPAATQLKAHDMSL